MCGNWGQVITGSAVKLYDNIDSMDFSNSEFLDFFCGCATGMEASAAMLYRDNVELLFNLRNHLKLTARTSPFNRSDALRRVLQFTIRKPTQSEWEDKDTLMDELLECEADCKLEILVRLQNIVRAYDANGTKRYAPESEMPEYEMFTYRCADYEGFLPEMRRIWIAHMQMYRDAINEGNPLVYAIKAWLGEDKGYNEANAGREVTATTLWSEINRLSQRLGLKETYRSVSSFGKHISKHVSSLKVLGFHDNGLTGGKKRFRFNPSTEQLEECRRIYSDLRTACHGFLMENAEEAASAVAN